MRLLIVNHEYPPVGGGASNASQFLARTLVKKGHRVDVVTSAFGEYRRVSIEDGVHVHRIPAFRSRIDRANLGQMLCFAGSAMAFAPGVARTAQVEGVIAYFTLPSGLVGYGLKVLRGLPYVVSLQGGDVPGLVPEINRTHRRVRWLRQRVLRSARAIIANSQGLADLSARTDPIPVEVVPNGVDVAMFHPRAQSDCPALPFRILFVGRLQKQKNLGLLLDELARLRHGGLTEFRLHVAGDGPLGAELRERVELLGLVDSVTWHGWIAKPELVALYQNADCFVNPSLYEGLPNTVTEAMACGLPVVASQVIGNDALVIHGRTGLLFSLAEPQQLGNALENLIRDRATAQRMGAEGRAQVMEHYSWEAAAAAYLRLLSKPAYVRLHEPGHEAKG